MWGAVCVYVRPRGCLPSPSWAFVKGVWATRGERTETKRRGGKREKGGMGGGEGLVVWDDRNKKKGAARVEIDRGLGEHSVFSFLL